MKPYGNEHNERTGYFRNSSKFGKLSRNNRRLSRLAARHTRRAKDKAELRKMAKEGD